MILEAAVAEFAAHGYAGARIASIATRAGVNQQLISYYFDGKEGLYRALSEGWAQRETELVEPGTALPEQFRQYALEALNNPDGVRLLAWGGLEYTGPETDLDHARRSERLVGTVGEVRAQQEAGRVPAEVDPACLIIMMMAAAMATVTIPPVIEGICQVDPRSPEFVNHYADQVAIVCRALGLDSADDNSANKDDAR